MFMFMLSRTRDWLVPNIPKCIVDTVRTVALLPTRCDSGMKMMVMIMVMMVIMYISNITNSDDRYTTQSTSPPQ